MNKQMPHLGRAGQMPCQCANTGTCHVCKVRKAVEHLEKVYFDDTKRAEAVHNLIAALKEAAQK